MTDPTIILYHSPIACSQVSVCALEWAGLPYRLELVNVAAGQQRSPGYLAVSPLGKVPHAVIDGAGLTENVAIITLVADLRPDSGVFPRIASPLDRAEVISGLSFCSGTVHPQVRGIFAPHRFTDGNPEGIRAKSCELAAKSFAYADAHLAERGWWLSVPSIVDVYLNWTAGIARRGGLDLEPYPEVVALPERLKAIPAFAAMLRIEEESAAKLARLKP